MILPVAILAGGIGTRLRPVTESIPKSLVDIHGEPFISHQLKLLRSRGIKKAVICAGYLGEMIQDFVGDGARFGIKVDFSFDGERPLGTGGALKKALDLLGKSFFVLYGDSYLRCDYRAVQTAFTRSKKKALMTIFRNDGAWGTSNVEFKDGKIIAYKKRSVTPEMRYIDYGLGIFHAEAFDIVPEDTPYDLARIYQLLLKDGQLAAFEVKERFYEIGSFNGLEEIRTFLSKGSQVMAENESPVIKGREKMDFTKAYLREAKNILEQLETDIIEKIVVLIERARANKGRLFILGVGGGAANASHAVNDFRKITGIEAYTPTDNVSELTARTNDDGWASTFVEWLKISRLHSEDVVLVFSVGGGNLEKNVSPNLVAALEYAKQVGAKVCGVVGRDGGYTAKVADACVVIPTVNPAHVTPHTEAFQAVVWHLLVTHPRLKYADPKGDLPG